MSPLRQKPVFQSFTACLSSENPPLLQAGLLDVWLVVDVFLCLNNKIMGIDGSWTVTSLKLNILHQ